MALINPATAQPQLATLDMVKTYLSLKPTNTRHDAQLMMMLLACDSWVLSMANQNGRKLVAEESMIEFFDGQGSPRLFLKYRPVIQVREIRQDPAVRPSWDHTVIVPPECYRVYPEHGIVKRADLTDWPRGMQNIRVIYDAGYLIVPAQITKGVIMFTAFLYGQAGTDGKSQERIGEYQYMSLTADQVPGLKLMIETFLQTPTVF